MDYTLKSSINKLRKISLYLFLFTNIAIFATLFIQNILTQSNFTYQYYGQSNQTIKNIDCNEANNFCYFMGLGIKKNETLGQCAPYENYEYFHVDGSILARDVGGYRNIVFDNNKKIKPEYKNSKIFISYKKTNLKNIGCIKNYPIFYSIYKVFPEFPNLIAKIKLDPNYLDPTGKVVNPFFYGETSISNVAKRYPLYFIFKPFLFVASLLMIIYWIYTRKVILSFNKSEKIQTYYILGVLSGIFLFLHVYFLGSEIENEIFKKLRRYIIAFFILFELMAQFFLIKKLLNIKNLINDFINNFVLQLKWFFVLFFLFITILITSLLIIYDLPKELDYIIEWNYFVILSFYYLLTFYLWKKINS